MRARMRWVALGFALVAAAVWHHLGLSLATLILGWKNLQVFLAGAWPPDLSVWSGGWGSLIETLEIAFLATVLGLALALPLAALAARNLAPWWVRTPIRALLSAIRVLPSLLWALVFVILVGIGPPAGVLAVTLYTVGYVGKLQYEALEGLPAGPLEAASAMGVPAVARLRWVVMPEAANGLISQALFMFEYNVRASTILGVVGAGGIGQQIQLRINHFQYDKVLALLVLVFITVLVIESISMRIRARFMEGEQRPTRVRWRDVVLPPAPG